VRLAIAFDPFNEIYREGFGMLQVRAAEMRAEALIAEADAAESQGLGNGVRSKELLRLYEEALLYRPHQPELNERAARAAIDGDELAKALEYAERAVEHRPEVADYHITLASVHQARGNPGHAAKALEQALQLEPQNLTASKQLATLRRA
jgi:tetratricopeptide (TPR) repeat protein